MPPTTNTMSEAPGLTIRELVLEVREGLAALTKETRDTRHQARTELRAMELRIVELESFRHDTEKWMAMSDQRADRYIPVIEGLQKHITTREAMGEAVKQALQESQHRGWTRRERIFAIVLVVCSIVGATGTLLGLYLAGT